MPPNLEESPCGTPVAGIFGCARRGDFFRGHMTIDTSILAADGPTRALGSLVIASAVPEPETWVMLLAGVALVLFVRVRRSTSA